MNFSPFGGKFLSYYALLFLSHSSLNSPARVGKTEEKFFAALGPARSNMLKENLEKYSAAPLVATDSLVDGLEWLGGG